ncbi:MAG: elongation factor P [Candidatus Colwellbacteria bacterium]|nr:elongation factor P [Candidatus Colwellbacteria bacterium]
MLSYNELRPGEIVIVDGKPCEILEYAFLRMQQRKPVAKTKLRNLITGSVQERTFHQNESLEEAEIEKPEVKYLYNSRGQYWFNYAKDSSKRISMPEEKIGPAAIFLKPDLALNVLVFKDEIIGIKLPIKADYKVIEAPPAVKGNTAQGGTKTITIEGGAKINAPLFVNEGDIVKVHIENSTYVERVEKA